MERGWVYVLVNSSIPGMAKVGRTIRAPHDRAAELSGVTGVATPFIVAYEQEFADCHAAERAIHAELDRRGLRVRSNREFFACPCAEIIRLLLQSGEAAADNLATPAAGTSFEALLEAGDRALYGLGDALQDTGEAVRCFKLAAARGALAAYERLGRIDLALFATKRDRASRRRTFCTLKEGIRRGDPYCYCLLADLFALEGHASNVAKCWALFFAAPVDHSTSRFARVACRYIAQCQDLQILPAHLPVLARAADAMLRALLAELELFRTDPVERRRIAACLRWVHANVPVESASRLQAVPGRSRREWLPAPGLVVA